MVHDRADAGGGPVPASRRRHGRRVDGGGRQLRHGSVHPRRRRVVRRPAELRHAVRHRRPFASRFLPVDPRHRPPHRAGGGDRRAWLAQVNSISTAGEAPPARDRDRVPAGGRHASSQNASGGLKAIRSAQRILTLNAWNEWTEGSYLEPDTEHGYGYLEAVREVFGPPVP
ncbi:MAG: hypothetical protein FJ399_03215 [Verrucomicrobia bacterium]|nr:hypothetical protein [Verrucomicrobiota bacterium]